MRMVLMASTISGIKSLDKEIRIQYTNKGSSTIPLSSGSVKAIYGPNGSGKSAICHAYDFYKLIVSDEAALKDPVFASSLHAMVSKKTKSFLIENDFVAIVDEKERQSYRHRIVISIASGIPVVAEEFLGSLNVRGQLSTTYAHIKDGELVQLYSGIPLAPEDLPFLKFGSFLPYIVSSTRFAKLLPACFVHIAIPFLFATQLYIAFGSSADIHAPSMLDSFNHLKEIDFSSLVSSTFIRLQTAKNSQKTKSYWTGKQTDEESIRNKVRKMVPFLQAINDSILDVTATFQHQDSALSTATLVFHYADYSVDLEYESTGIKKAVELFDAFYYSSRGNISIIDEIDAGLHDVFITKLVDFFSLYGEGQIVMTTHNVHIMNSLKHRKHGIDFLSCDSHLVPWVQKGDASPSRAYLNGAIERLPFNLQPSDFVPIFFGDDDQ